MIACLSHLLIWHIIIKHQAMKPLTDTSAIRLPENYGPSDARLPVFFATHACIYHTPL